MTAQVEIKTMLSRDPTGTEAWQLYREALDRWVREHPVRIRHQVRSRELYLGPDRILERFGPIVAAEFKEAMKCDGWGLTQEEANR